MKKGCFFAAITIFTIVIAIGFYLYKKYWPEIKSYGQGKVMELALDEVNKKIDKLNKSIYQDSLKIFLTTEINNLREDDTGKSFETFQDLMDQTEFFINDGTIDSLEITALKNMVKKYERSEKDGN